jgi:hypothetical protein
VQQVAELAQVQYSNANALVGQLMEAGLLREITGKKRNRRFAYQPYLDLFIDEASAAPQPG